MRIPEGNPLTSEKVALGRGLFADRLLSRDRAMSCATCHDPRRAFTDGRAVSVGVFGRRGTRNVPTLINRGHGTSHFWDGRTSSLEEQVLEPIQDPKELDMSLEELVGRLKQKGEYRRRFQAVFGRTIPAEDVARALASYVRTIRSGNAPVDRYRYLTGGQGALSAAALRGLSLFRGQGNCTRCHLGPNFTDEDFHNTGVAWRDGKLLDPGRLAITGKKEDHGAFKTPTLREVARTAPYMHDGSIKSLQEVIEHYDRGGKKNPYLDRRIRPLVLSPREKRDLVEFLKSLSGEVVGGDQAYPPKSSRRPRARSTRSSTSSSRR